MIMPPCAEMKSRRNEAAPSKRGVMYNWEVFYMALLAAKLLRSR